MKLPWVSRKRYEREIEEYAAIADQALLREETVRLAHETLAQEYVKVQEAAEEALDYVEKLWNKLSVGDANGMFDLVLDNALPLLKKHSAKYKDVDIEEAKANVAAGFQAR